MKLYKLFVLYVFTIIHIYVYLYTHDILFVSLFIHFDLNSCRKNAHPVDVTVWTKASEVFLQGRWMGKSKKQLGCSRFMIDGSADGIDIYRSSIISIQECKLSALGYSQIMMIMQ